MGKKTKRNDDGTTTVWEDGKYAGKVPAAQEAPEPPPELPEGIEDFNHNEDEVPAESSVNQAYMLFAGSLHYTDRRESILRAAMNAGPGCKAKSQAAIDKIINEHRSGDSFVLRIPSGGTKKKPLEIKNIPEESNIYIEGDATNVKIDAELCNVWVVEGATVDVSGSSTVYADSYCSVTARQDTEVIADDSAQVEAFDHARVTATRTSVVTAHDDSNVVAAERATVNAYDRSYVRMHGTEQNVCEAWVFAYDNATVKAKGRSSVIAEGNAVVTAEGHARVVLNGNDATCEATQWATVTRR